MHSTIGEDVPSYGSGHRVLAILAFTTLMVVVAAAAWLFGRAARADAADASGPPAAAVEHAGHAGHDYAG